MKKFLITGIFAAGFIVLSMVVWGGSLQGASAFAGQKRSQAPDNVYPLPRMIDDRFQVEILVNGRPVPEYAAR